MTKEIAPADQLLTVRDFLRYAVSRFNSAGLAFGHGVSTALDDAAYLVLEGLKLPIDQLEPFLDARLLADERQHLAALIEARVTTRKPTPYLVKRAYVQGVPFYVDERVIVPRSFIGELLYSDVFGGDDFTVIEDLSSIETVLDLCTGSGAIAILAANVFENAEIDAVDLSPEALDVARINVDDHKLADRIELYEGDLFAPLDGKRYDLILTNPPYVDQVAMDELPPEYLHEPAMALGSGLDGLDIVRRILAEAGAHLNLGGGLLCEIGTGREILEAEYPDLDFLWLDTAESEGEVFWLSAESLGAS
ncbi:50S ribosomal protein L3 N(5)-glutamine methyltransferase [Kaistia dalseonensis]|uniref:Ribosomal protein L3 glutamine methyltransferase n=1 Tax=Kaistia dalseonensis TaxID=410840 RepID=A0ABU0HAS7_9HYPH|nr:50S ribosomal protein L3 N(5)-glutamine methyltransferase [Kaistia dalseonensis]MCX5496470.1 50S ribosomal protein L3 N(5)-glutamine methyltransferase [Kaistia dalseonensis]MDQ0439092.1 ribosomal protein L3 glutamine methyltransferase [Kaistia dalseonensis]